MGSKTVIVSVLFIALVIAVLIPTSNSQGKTVKKKLGKCSKRGLMKCMNRCANKFKEKLAGANCEKSKYNKDESKEKEENVLVYQGGLQRFFRFKRSAVVRRPPILKVDVPSRNLKKKDDCVCSVRCEGDECKEDEDEDSEDKDKEDEDEDEDSEDKDNEDEDEDEDSEDKDKEDKDSEDKDKEDEDSEDKDEDDSDERKPKDKKQNCKVSKWTKWTSCSVSCGGGVQVRTREIQKQPKNGGKDCPKLLETKESCNSEPCDTSEEDEEVDCKVASWSKWTECSKSCDSGTKMRYRKIKQASANDGKECPALTQEETCNAQECPEDCQVSSWEEWTRCSVTCGGGVKVRTRSIEKQPSSGGKECQELLEINEDCNSEECDSSQEEKVDCKVNDWSSWTQCSKSCDRGSQMRYRTIEKAPENDGQKCPDLVEDQDCNQEKCSQPVDCELNSWSDWTKCSVSCGGGIQLRTRTIKTQPSELILMLFFT